MCMTYRNKSKYIKYLARVCKLLCNGKHTHYIDSNDVRGWQCTSHFPVIEGLIRIRSRMRLLNQSKLSDLGKCLWKLPIFANPNLAKADVFLGLFLKTADRHKKDYRIFPLQSNYLTRWNVLLPFKPHN